MKLTKSGHPRLSITNAVDQREEISAVLAALQIAGHALGVAHNHMYTLCSCMPDDARLTHWQPEWLGRLGKLTTFRTR